VLTEMQQEELKKLKEVCANEDNECKCT